MSKAYFPFLKWYVLPTVVLFGGICIWRFARHGEAELKPLSIGAFMLGFGLYAGYSAYAGVLDGYVETHYSRSPITRADRPLYFWFTIAAGAIGSLLLVFLTLTSSLGLRW